MGILPGANRMPLGKRVAVSLESPPRSKKKRVKTVKPNSSQRRSTTAGRETNQSKIKDLWSWVSPGFISRLLWLPGLEKWHVEMVHCLSNFIILHATQPTKPKTPRRIRQNDWFEVEQVPLRRTFSQELRLRARRVENHKLISRRHDNKTQHQAKWKKTGSSATLYLQ